MSKIKYTEWNPKPKSVQLVYTANDIIDEYEAAGYTLTLRQLYYQFVARDFIENTERSYKNLGSIITKARMAGLISWEAIEDRGRKHNKYWFEEDPSEPVRDLPRWIRYDQWDRQDTYVEVWVEKEALGNVIERACNPLLVPHTACKGYLSASEAWRAGQRFEAKLAEGKECRIIHLGDHDPSGIDMTRDNQDRIDIFTGFTNPCVDGVEVTRIALNMDQVERYRPPVNPTKLKDSRAKEYIKRYGKSSWELDALEPAILEKLIKDEVEQYIDFNMWDGVEDLESETRDTLREVYNRWGDVKELLENG